MKHSNTNHNRWQSIIFATLFSLSSILVYGYDFAVGGVYYSKIDDRHCEVTYKDNNYGSYCTNRLIVPATVVHNDTTYTVSRIGDCAFLNSAFLLSLELPETITSIGEQAFSCCHFPIIFKIPNNVTEIGVLAFYNCTYEAKYQVLEIPPSVTTIGENAFKCSNQHDAVAITDLEAWCRIDFANKYSNPTIYGAALIIKDNEVSVLSVPSSISEIGNSAFAGAKFTSITIPNTVRTIGQNAFYGCTELQDIKLGNRLESIGENAFNGCDKLQIITSLNTTPPTLECSFTDSQYTNIKVYVPTDAISDYSSAAVWSQFANIIGYETSSIQPTTTDSQLTIVGNQLRIKSRENYYIATVAGVTIDHGTGATTLSLPTGIYIITIDGNTSKIYL